MLQLAGPHVEPRLKVGVPIKAGVFQAGAQHAFPTFFDHGHILGVKVEHGQEVGHEPSFGVFHPKTFLVLLHAGEQHFARQLKV